MAAGRGKVLALLRRPRLAVEWSGEKSASSCSSSVVDRGSLCSEGGVEGALPICQFGIEIVNLTDAFTTYRGEKAKTILINFKQILASHFFRRNALKLTKTC